MEKMDTDEIKKLRILLDHWVKHNEDHAREYRNWATKMEAKGLKNLAQYLKNASSNTLDANKDFISARKLLK